MLEDARQVDRSKLNIIKKMHALRMFVFPQIDCWMMSADLGRSNLERWDAKISGMIGEWLGIHGSPCHKSAFIRTIL
jgi:hypothetical protein